MRNLLVIALLPAAAACSTIQAAHTRLPAEFGPEPDRIELVGLQGPQTGAYTAGAYSGRYDRYASGTRILGAFAAKNQHAGFSITGPGITPALVADCMMSEQSVQSERVEVLTAPMSYRCTFSQGGEPARATFDLHETNEAAGTSLGYKRDGTFRYAGAAFEIRSEHRLQETALPTAAPNGYVFLRGGRPVGAIDLNGSPQLVLPMGTDEATSRALTIAALATALLWDPADSDMHDW
ncbi:hypothetical protein F7D01_13295 [Erythrobacter sp. 3-20A1M]|uniref:hypothetical protein n=1 Tax=Erythrobacter sp. 3-20A1M TaxID=2653850 RepID=UPI001BFC9DE5|nr:hypothetical protein [Erythrobacter sp. 3-20A1M]QWC57907.1 hypothetical protein F7D01_13295 [Erythrobacter sp. 3-20A1M]